MDQPLVGQRWYGIWIVPKRIWMMGNDGAIIWGPREVIRAQVNQIAKISGANALQVKSELEVKPFGDEEPSLIQTAGNA